MDPIVVILLVGLAIIALVMVYTRTYLNIIAEDNRCVEAWKVVEKDMARRGELVLSLEAMMAERVGRGADAIEPVSAARTAVDVAGKPEDKAAASDALTEELRAIFEMAERSTVLMTNPDLVQLLKDIADAENSLARSQQDLRLSVPAAQEPDRQGAARAGARAALGAILGGGVRGGAARLTKRGSSQPEGLLA